MLTIGICGYGFSAVAVYAGIRFRQDSKKALSLYYFILSALMSAAVTGYIYVANG